MREYSEARLATTALNDDVDVNLEPYPPSEGEKASTELQMGSSPHSTGTCCNRTKLHFPQGLDAMSGVQCIFVLHRFHSYFAIVGAPLLWRSTKISQTLTACSPFLSYVSSTSSFDTQLSQYVNSSYVQYK